MLLSASMMLKIGLNEAEAAENIEKLLIEFYQEDLELQI
ncbi:MAG: hypothetical protein Ct9H90mP3_6400 [Flammeovirgaceae bacterium]|nr:MAG: hypothetical protein Ct9H90mP3_6400 [Flammeovirgaceae bacterium]